jgi:hypothetical protein
LKQPSTIASSVPAFGPTLVYEITDRGMHLTFVDVNKISSLAGTFFPGAEATRQSGFSLAQAMD